MHVTSTAVSSMFPGIADGGYADATHTNTVVDFNREAKEAGVRLLACSMALHEHRRADETLISEQSRARVPTLIRLV
jgi:hypothetical protein